MATFFGEVLPVFSRAVEDEDDDDAALLPHQEQYVCLRWSPETRRIFEEKQTLQCSSIIIAVGKAATAFANTYLVENNTDVIGTICSGMSNRESNTLCQRSLRDRTCNIHRLKNKSDVLLCLCNTIVTPEQAFSWTTQLFSSLDKSTHVTVISSSHASEYKSDIPSSDLPFPMLTALKTSTFSGKAVCRYLQQPNTVTGLPAQILTYCQSHSLPAVLYHTYTDVLYLDSITINSFKPLLRISPFRDILLKNPRAAEKLAKLTEVDAAADNNLYI
ncbi:proteasome assembly chaperone 1-like [Lineus longissimus]|uniref:proteasome assembly chaperone 1-like n=1 Tax=Lineus longissimus TaxID=88925 RepID=UPI00315CC1B9